MIAEIILGLVILALLGFIGWERYQGQKERAKFMNALIAKTADQYRDLELTDKVKPIDPPAPAEPDLIPEGEVTDKEFSEMLKGVA